MNYPVYIHKYLKKYSNDNWKLEFSGSGFFDNIIVIPAIAEFENVQLLLESLLNCSPKYFDKSLFVFVVNNTVSASSEIREDNKKSLEFIRGLFAGNGSLSGRVSRVGLNIGLVDVSSPGNEMDDKSGGVGVARKIGMDLALQYFDYSSESKKILVCLDADCTVSSNYLDRIVNAFNSSGSKAGYVRYEHRWAPGGEYAEAIVCYEIFLRYYVLGLKYAESAYAIHTIGSTLICDAEAYTKVEGMNKRQAAEDFYFIEKLSKNFDILEINDAVVYPSGRGSWRVPFGTGQRVNRFLSGEQDEYSLYSPESFNLLKEWNNYYYSDSHTKFGDFRKYSKDLNEHLFMFLEEQSFFNQWDKILAHSTSPMQILKQKKIWFDGFRTLKLIHHLRDNCYPNINMFDAVDSLMEFLGIESDLKNESGNIPDFITRSDYLQLLREHT